MCPIPVLYSWPAFNNIPHQTTGVYYFHNQTGDVIYIGKSRDIKKRVAQHFKSLRNKKTFKMLNDVTDISYEVTGNELIALLLESEEIKKHRPVYNVSQQRTQPVSYYGIFQKRDRQQYLNLFVKRIRKREEAILSFESESEAKQTLEKIVAKFNLCLAKCDDPGAVDKCYHYHLKMCYGACINKEISAEYNKRAQQAIKSFTFENESFIIITNGRSQAEKSIICIEQGKYKGFGYVDCSFNQPTGDELLECIKKHSHNKNIQQILFTWFKSHIAGRDYIKVPFQPTRLQQAYEDLW